MFIILTKYDGEKNIKLFPKINYRTEQGYGKAQI
jgi:hypothetical protein